MNRKPVEGVGINDSDYVTEKYSKVDGKQKLIWRCTFYQVWRNMLMRCYSEKYQARQPTYKGCVVCDEWLIFSNFRRWMEKQDWEGKQLDKDLIDFGNKVYCPDKCIFVDQRINLQQIIGTGRFKRGVTVHKRYKSKNFTASYTNLATGKHVHIGYFHTEEEAYSAWRSNKIRSILEFAETLDNEIIKTALINLCSSDHL